MGKIAELFTKGYSGDHWGFARNSVNNGWREEGRGERQKMVGWMDGTKVRNLCLS